MGAVSSKDDHGDSTDANGGGRGSQGREYVEMGPRIMKVFPDEPGFDPRRDWDIVCDVRSPAEWEDDHVPGSVSTPVLDNEERARVGTIYKQESPFLAKKLGASLVAKNLGKILDEHFQDKEKDTRVLVYCWRGGERSMSLAHVLSRVGFKVGLIPGGYKRYRAGVLEFLRTMDGFRYHLIAGKTGCAKGKMLDQLKAQGAQVLDLEAMAQHRGSVLGGGPGVGQQAALAEIFRHQDMGAGEDLRSIPADIRRGRIVDDRAAADPEEHVGGHAQGLRHLARGSHGEQGTVDSQRVQAL